VASSPDDRAHTVSQGLAALLAAAGLGPIDVRLLMHVTAVGIKAIGQRRSAQVTLLVSQIVRDVLEIGRNRMLLSIDFRADTEAPPLGPRGSLVGTLEQRTARRELSREPRCAESPQPWQRCERRRRMLSR
jgi:N-methylhydantoinase A